VCCIHYRSTCFDNNIQTRRSSWECISPTSEWLFYFFTEYRVSTNLTEQISWRFQEGFQETSRTCLHCFSLLCNVPNTESTFSGACDDELQPDKKATTFLNKRSGTQFYDRKPMQSIINILHKNFQEDYINSRFPGFPAVVDTLE